MTGFLHTKGENQSLPFRQQQGQKPVPVLTSSMRKESAPGIFFKVSRQAVFSSSNFST
jgi:hypothetical protein